MKLIYRTSAEVHEKVVEAFFDKVCGLITDQEYNEIIANCFRIEEKRKMETA